MDHLGLEQAVDRLGEGIVVAIADAADGRLDAGLGEPLGVADRQVLRAPVAMMHEAATLDRMTRVQGRSRRSFRSPSCPHPPSTSATVEPKPARPRRSGGHIEISLGGGRRVRVGSDVDAAALRRVLDALEGR